MKIAPDLADADVDALADLALELGLDGIIATNTWPRRMHAGLARRARVAGLSSIGSVSAGGASAGGGTSAGATSAGGASAGTSSTGTG